jgi:hypothetical protein
MRVDDGEWDRLGERMDEMALRGEESSLRCQWLLDNTYV